MLVTVLVFILSSIYTEQVLAESQSQVISKVSTSDKVIALTFDDGSDGENLQEIMEILEENQIKATFFITGRAAKAHPELVKSLLKNGNVIGNHSYSHPYFTDLSSTEINLELNKTEKAIKKITGQSSLPFFRPPYGDYNSSVLQAVGEAGYINTITWTIDTLDWKGISASKIAKKVLNKAAPGSIVLMHAGKGAANTPDALPDIIKGLKDLGYQFVTISELLDYAPSEVVDTEKSEDTSSIEYTVKKGDTLTKISRQYGVTVQQLAKTNHIINVNLIYPNQILIIPK